MKSLNLKKLKMIKVIFFDVDGVLTNGDIFILNTGEIKKFYSHDEGGLKYLLWNGIEVGFISGNTSKSVVMFAEKIGVKYVFRGISKKLPEIAAFLKKHGYKWEELAYMGDDLIDLPVMMKAGVSFAPSNSSSTILEYADHVTKNAGGNGAVREVAELILRAQGKYDDFIKKYTDPEK